MDDQTGLKILRDELAKVKAQGQESLSVEVLDQVIIGLQEQAGTSLDHRKLHAQHILAQYDADVRSGIEAFKATVESGREALNALLLINGGAVVALLGFVGAMAAKPNGLAVATSMRAPLLRFGVGVLLGAVAFGARYVSQALYASNMRKAGHVANAVSIALSAAGYSVFVWGLVGAGDAIGVKGP
jgi:hypothetical protein